MKFEDAYRIAYRKVRRYVTMRCSSRDIVLEWEDVMQETYLQSWRIWDNRETDNVTAWFIGVARRVFAHMLRENRAEKRGGGIPMLEWRQEEDMRSSPATQELSVWVAQLQAKMQNFGPAQQYALRGAMEGLNNKEIAAKHGSITHQAVAGSLKLARAKLIQIST